MDFNQCARGHRLADDICLLSQSHSDMQQKTNDLNANGVVLVSKPAHPRLRKCE